jgi:hypothetical protein
VDRGAQKRTVLELPRPPSRTVRWVLNLADQPATCTCKADWPVSLLAVLGKVHSVGSRGYLGRPAPHPQGPCVGTREGTWLFRVGGSLEGGLSRSCKVGFPQARPRVWGGGGGGEPGAGAATRRGARPLACACWPWGEDPGRSGRHLPLSPPHSQPGPARPARPAWPASGAAAAAGEKVRGDDLTRALQARRRRSGSESNFRVVSPHATGILLFLPLPWVPLAAPSFPFIPSPTRQNEQLRRGEAAAAHHQPEGAR